MRLRCSYENTLDRGNRICVKNSLRVLVPDAPSPLLLTWYGDCRKTVEACMCLKKQDGPSNQVPFQRYNYRRSGSWQEEGDCIGVSVLSRCQKHRLSSGILINLRGDELHLSRSARLPSSLWTLTR